MDEAADDGPALALIALVIVLLIGYGAVAIALSATGADPASDAPNAQWNLSRVNDSHVRLVHAGGQPVPASQLSLSVNGTTRYPNWNVRVVTDGDSGILQAKPGSEIVLVWQQTGTDHVVLDRWSDV